MPAPVEAPDEHGRARCNRCSSRRGGCPTLSRSRLQALIRAGEVRRDGAAVADLRHRVKAGETYTVDVPAPEPAAPQAQAIPLAVVYEDAHLIVIDKPAGLAVHPGPGHATGTLVNALIAHCGASLSGIGGVKRPGIVHRLDKDTTGLLVVAKTDRRTRGSPEQFAAHGADGRLERRYLALVWGAPDRPRGAIDAALARSSANRTKIAVVSEAAGRHAVTRYAVLETYGAAETKPIASLLELALETGRTHQIRVHLAHIGHPLLGDMTYGAGFKASARNLSAKRRRRRWRRSAARRCTRASSPSCIRSRASVCALLARCRPTWPASRPRSKAADPRSFGVLETFALRIIPTIPLWPRLCRDRAPRLLEVPHGHAFCGFRPDPRRHSRERVRQSAVGPVERARDFLLARRDPRDLR